MKNRRAYLIGKYRSAGALQTAETLESRTLLSGIVYSYVTAESAYSAAPGKTVSVDVYLKETLNGNTSIISGHGESGLLGAGFEVVSATRPTSPATITAVSADAADFTGQALAHVNNTAVSTLNEGDVVEATSFTATHGVGLGNGHGAATNEVYLGSLTITAGSKAGVTTFSLRELDVKGIVGGNTLTYPDAYDLDISSGTPTPYTGVGTTVTTFSVTTTGTVNHPPVISGQSFLINSKSLTGTVVGTVAASDPDAGQTLTYALSADPTLHAINYSGAFAINSHGVVTIKNPADLPAVAAGKTGTATFKVTVTDNGSPAMSSSAIMTVTRTPTKTMPPIFKVTTQSYTLAETVKIGVTVGTLAASPAYTGQKFTYSLTGTDAADFAIGTTGIITTKIALDYQHAGHSYAFNVLATDGTGASAQSSKVGVILSVSDGTPTITGAIASQKVTDTTTIVPFTKVVIGDVIPTHIDTLTITLSSTANGAFTAASLVAATSAGSVKWTTSSGGVYKTSGTPANLTKAIAKLVFQPVVKTGTVTTKFTLSVSDGTKTATNTTTTVVSAGT